MAYPTNDEILVALPYGGKPLTTLDVDTWRTRWIASLKFQPKTQQEKALAEMVVWAGATAELEAKQLRGSGPPGPLPQVLYDRIREAHKIRREYADLRGKRR